MISRGFISSYYGGNMRSTCPEISKKFKEKHGLDDFMFFHPSYQPVAPQVPGACGLFFSTSSSVGEEWCKLQRVFTRIESNVWQYMGMYRLTSSPSLTRRVAWPGTEGKQDIFKFVVIYFWTSSYRFRKPGEKRSAKRIGDRTSVHECLPGKGLDESRQKRNLKTCPKKGTSGIRSPQRR